MRIQERRTSALVLLLITAMLLPAAPRSAQAFTRETHYYLRFALSLATCFDFDEAHLIASGDWMLDGNLSTHAEPTPFLQKNKIGFHAFGHSDARFNELWERSRSEPDLALRLIKLGQFMHFLEDWESHAGFGLKLGHARATFSGRDPDSLGSDRDKNQRMVQSALDHLIRTCGDLGRLDDPDLPTSDPDYFLVWLMRLLVRDGVMEDLYEIHDPAWKKGKIKGVRKRHLQIREDSVLRVEEAVAGMRGYMQKRIPGDFVPGENGIPEVLQIPYDKDGNILAAPSSPDPVQEVLARNRVDREEEEIVLLVEAKSQFSGGFHVDVVVANFGTEASDPGSVEVYVIDADSEEQIGMVSVAVEALEPGAEIRRRATVRARTASGQEVIIGALARIADFSALDNEAWLMDEDEANELPEVPLITEVDPDLPGDERIEFVADPKMWIMDGEAICVLLTAATTEGDATEKLIEVALDIETDEGVELGSPEFPPRWGASALEGRTGRSFARRDKKVGVERSDDMANLYYELAISCGAITKACSNR